MGGNMIGPCVIPYGTGVDYMGAMIRNAIGDPVEFISTKNSTVVTRLLAFKAGIVTKLPNFAQLEKEYSVEIYHHIELGQQIKEYHTNLDGCGYVVVKDDCLEKAIIKADKILDIIRNTIFS